MKYFIPGFIVICFQVQFANAKQEVQWTDHMRSMRENLSVLFPVIYPKSERELKVNIKAAEKSSRKLAETAAKLLKQNAVAYDKDPSLKLISNLFSKETERAARELKKGNWNYGRSVLKSTTAYCIACHTRNSWGPNFSGMSDAPDFLKDVSLMGKGTFYAATRQFDRALEEFERVISDRNFQKSHSLDWERAVRQSLTIAIRVKQDPAKAISVTERVIANPEAPYYLKQEAEKWKKSLEEWQGESNRNPQTEEGLFAEAKRLLNQAKSYQEFAADRSADMLYLRASAALHSLLMKFSNGKYVGESYYLLGYSYEVLRDMDIWNLHEFYYVGCIHQNPHSEIARNCFRSYQNSIHAGYSGSGGTFLPDDVRAELKELEKLALPQGAM